MILSQIYLILPTEMHSQSSFEKTKITWPFHITEEKTEITTTVSRKNTSANTGKATGRSTSKQAATTAGAKSPRRQESKSV